MVAHVKRGNSFYMFHVYLQFLFVSSHQVIVHQHHPKKQNVHHCCTAIITNDGMMSGPSTFGQNSKVLDSDFSVLKILLLTCLAFHFLVLPSFSFVAVAAAGTAAVNLTTWNVVDPFELPC